MTPPTGFRRAVTALIALCLLPTWEPVRASDHADPLDLNALNPPKDGEPRITDLHVYLDKDQNPALPEAKNLIVSICVFPSMARLEEVPKDQVDAQKQNLVMVGTQLSAMSGGDPAAPKYKHTQPRPLNLKSYRYNIFMDLNAQLGFSSVADRERYGATILQPDDISSEVELEFTLNNDGSLDPANFRLTGLPSGRPVVNAPYRDKEINVRTGVFDDPFIFPRFFRTNIIGIVVSIPLDRFAPQQRNFLVWATTTKDGKQIDHVGRSQRTQLPRFDGLNFLPPSKHVADINRRHNNPTILEDFNRTFFSPLFARRPYDAMPDVLIFSRSQPTRFPNGRVLSDDVAALTAMAGDTQLWEASYTDDNRYPRVTMNDGEYRINPATGAPQRNPQGQLEQFSLKPFSNEFPYFASPWLVGEKPEYARPRLARPNLTNNTWRIFWLVEVVGLVVLGALLFFLVRSRVLRGFIALVVLYTLWKLGGVYAVNDPMMPMQASSKLCRLIGGGGVLGALVLGIFYALGWRHGIKRPPADAALPDSNQDLTLHDRQFTRSTFAEVKKQLFDPALRDGASQQPYYHTWGGPNEKPLPVYSITAGRLVTSLLAASRRTLRTRAVMRWGDDHKGFRRLLHPNGIILSGEWKINDAPPGTNYTGYFKPGSRALALARYSTTAKETHAGKWRSLALVANLYPTTDPNDAAAYPTASLITQEDLGGTTTYSIREAVLTNSPPVTPWRRGAGIFSFIITALKLLRADKQPLERQLYEISEFTTGAPVSNPSCPRFIKLTTAKGTVEVGGEGVDFRDEILAIMYDRGDATPKRPLVFDVAVSDVGERSNITQRVHGQKWTTIGTLTFTEAVASYNGDYVFHVPHPRWRDDRNDPKSVAREDLR
ncbi:hypothetical protein [Verrucomicrobium sp. BvORR034]|uniref:hypothetical protein n=1 Tax=Verrucomicrobium sp. BvORR034 TaxID=1396418 RepID=UPI000679C271|nr:hypothetical protein [Verrucomicrobium sp. BvORR034]